jgi:hypothetical protein
MTNLSEELTGSDRCPVGEKVTERQLLSKEEAQKSHMWGFHIKKLKKVEVRE